MDSAFGVALLGTGGGGGESIAGAWDATQSPLFENDTPTAGTKYLVTVAGSYDFGNGSIDFAIGDYAIYLGSGGVTWGKQDATPSASETINDSNETGATVADALNNNKLAVDLNTAKVTNKPSDGLTLEDISTVASTPSTFGLTFANILSDASGWGITGLVGESSQLDQTIDDDTVGSIINHQGEGSGAVGVANVVSIPEGDYFISSNTVVTIGASSRLKTTQGDILFVDVGETVVTAEGTENIYKITVPSGRTSLIDGVALNISGAEVTRFWSGDPNAVATNFQKIKDSVMSNIVAELSTGWITKPTLTANATTFDHSAGLLRHVDMATNPPTLSEVVVNAGSNISPSNIANSSTFISFGIGGINQTADQLTASQRRDYAEVGLVSHIDHVNVDAILNEQTETKSVMHQLGDLIRSIGFFSVSGNQIIGNGGGMTLQKTAGVGFALNINSAVDAKDPHRAIMASAPTASMFHILRDGNLSTNGVNTVINPDIWDNAGTEDAVTNNKFTMPRVYIFPNNSILFILGQEEFDNLADAKESAGSETFVLPPDVASGGLLLARIIIKQGVSDIANASQAFILPSSSIAGGGATQTPMQGSYDISTQPQIVTNATLGAIDFQSGTGNDADLIQRWRNNAGEVIASVDGLGNLALNGVNVETNIPSDDLTLEDVDAVLGSNPSALTLTATQASATWGQATAEISLVDAGSYGSDDVVGSKIESASVLGSEEILLEMTTNNGNLPQGKYYITTNRTAITTVEMYLPDNLNAIVGVEVGSIVTAHTTEYIYEFDVNIDANLAKIYLTVGGGSVYFVRFWDGNPATVPVPANQKIKDSFNATLTKNSDTDVSSNGWVLDEDNMVSNDATKVPTQQSVKKYVDDNVIGLFDDKGNYNADTNTPLLDSTPIAGILKGDVYTVNVAGNFFTQAVEIGDVLRALQDSPTLLTHWAITQANLDAPSIKSLYESNADTNAFTDSDQANVVKVELGMAVSDETTDLETGTAKTTFRMPYGMTLTEVRASVTTAPTGSVLTVDINEGGVSILSTKITIDATEKTSTTATIPPVISDSTLADDAEITIDIDTIGSTIVGTGLKIWLIGTRT